MVAYGVPVADLHKLAESIGARLEGVGERGKGTKFVLRPDGSTETYRKVNPVSGRRVAAICWHGHFEFFRELFRAYPSAKVKSSVLTYNGAEEFNEKASETGEARASSVPLCHGDFTERDCCQCEK